jgi:hypothetical protein
VGRDVGLFLEMSRGACPVVPSSTHLPGINDIKDEISEESQDNIK